jgi:hypothetical protein
MSSPTELAVLILILGSPWIFRWIQLKRIRAASDRARILQLLELPDELARAEAEQLLAAGPPFSFAPVGDKWLAKLRPSVPQGVFDVWSRYGAPLYRAETLARLAPHVMETADERHRRILLGYQAPGALYRIGYRNRTELVFCSAATEVLYEVSLGGDLPDEFVEVRQFPTIYHWLLTLAPRPNETLLRPAGPPGSDSLVRPARAGQASPADELLRADESRP